MQQLDAADEPRREREWALHLERGTELRLEEAVVPWMVVVAVLHREGGAKQLIEGAAQLGHGGLMRSAR